MQYNLEHYHTERAHQGIGSEIIEPPAAGFLVGPTIMTEEELTCFLHTPEIGNATDYGHVIENLKRVHSLPPGFISVEGLHLSRIQ